MKIKNNADGNGLTIKTHCRHELQDVIHNKGLPNERKEQVKVLVAKIRQCTLFPKTALKYVAYKITAHLEGRAILKRAKWLRNEPPPADFVQLGQQLDLLW